MSRTPVSNPHFATANFRLEGVHEWQAEEGVTDATLLATVLDAQTEATLALAYEQRTANLIALHAALRERRDNGGALEVLTQIKERMH